MIEEHIGPAWLRAVVKVLPKSDAYVDEPLPVRLRLTLENLGPIFVKLGQVLSTRPDILPPEYALELAKLQDKVPPFDGMLAREHVEKSLGLPLSQLYAEFET